MEQNQINDESKRNPTKQSEGADQPLLGVGSGKWNFKDDILYYGTKKIAELYKEVDGYYYLNSDGLAQGCYSGYILTQIGECIDLINKTWDTQVNKAFEELNARSDA